AAASPTRMISEEVSASDASAAPCTISSGAWSPPMASTTMRCMVVILPYKPPNDAMRPGQPCGPPGIGAAPNEDRRRSAAVGPGGELPGRQDDAGGAGA